MSRLGRRIVVELTHEDAEQLQTIAEQERRTIQDQAAIFLERIARHGHADVDEFRDLGPIGQGEAYARDVVKRGGDPPQDVTGIPLRPRTENEEEFFRDAETFEEKATTAAARAFEKG